MSRLKKQIAEADTNFLVGDRVNSQLEKLLVGMGASLEPEREKDDDAYRAEDSLTEFFRQAWKVMEPGVEYIHGWHIEAICEHLEAVTRGEIHKLLINMPPRHAKSSLVSVAWPAWEWITRPWMKYLYSSYSLTLSVRDSVACRRLIMSPWYQRNWGNVFSLVEDVNAKMRFENSQHGVRIATSVGGTATGEGGDRVVCFPYEAMVLTEKGPMMIGHIVDFRIPVRVWSYDEESGEPVLAEIGEYRKNPGRDVRRYYFTGSKNIVCTEDHKIQTDKGLVQAKDLNPVKHTIPVFCSSYVHDVYPHLSGPSHVNFASEYLGHEDATYCLTIPKYHRFMVEVDPNYYIVVSNCDDPHNVKEAESAVVREGVLEWWSQAMSTRLNDPKKGAYVVVMQRVHDMDLSGKLIRDGDYEHLCLPCRYEGKKTHWKIGWQDPRKKEGELLWPERFDEKWVSQLEKTLGSYAAAAQLQQRPTPAEGGIFKKAWFQTYEHKPHFVRVIESWDTATSEKDYAAYSVGEVWGETSEGYLYLVHVERERYSFPQLKASVVALHRRFNGNAILVEDKSSGRQICQELGRGKRLPIIPIQVGRQDKVARALACSATVESGRVYIPAQKTWLADFMQEVLTFPNGEYKDQVDAMTQALNYLGGSAVTSMMDFS